jgi:hypothetical protein
MTCTEARRAMTTAERSELRGEGESALAAHVRECTACRMIALRLEAGTELIGELVAERGWMSSAPAARFTAGRVAALAMLPLAAALVGVLVLERDARTPAPPPPAVERVATSVVAVDVAPGQTATVLKTKDPKVTIVWLTPGRTQ